jgi:hypothetical protein
MVGLTYAMYEISAEYLRRIISTDCPRWPRGGSVIKCPPPLNCRKDTYGHSWC